MDRRRLRPRPDTPRHAGAVDPRCGPRPDPVPPGVRDAACDRLPRTSRCPRASRAWRSTSGSSSATASLPRRPSPRGRSTPSLSTVMQGLVLAALLLFSESSLDFGLQTPSGPPVRALVAVVAIGVALVAVVMLVRRLRDAIAERVRRWWPDVKTTLASLRAGNKLGLLLGGSLATEVLFAVTLGVFANAFGYDIALTDLLLINISVSLLATFLPVPGGIGVTGVRPDARPERGGHAGGSCPRRRRALPRRDVLPSARLGLRRDALAAAERAPVTLCYQAVARRRCGGWWARCVPSPARRPSSSPPVPRRTDRGRAGARETGRRAVPRTLLPASSSRGENVPSPPFPGDTVTIPPPIPLFPGSPTS